MSDDKPFVCSQSGCGMRFANEDHLSVHEAKHEMSLALTSSGATRTGCLLTFVADQTPTPTKFLRNCEEMGLFHELSKNPFEEAFKKASEDSKNLDLQESASLYPATSSLVDTITVETVSMSDSLSTPTPLVLDSIMQQVVRSCAVKSESSVDVEVAASGEAISSRFIPLPGPNKDTGSTISTCSIETRTESIPQCTGSTQLVDTDSQCSLVSCDTASSADCASNTLYLEVMITAPSGDVIPVHIPATVLASNTNVHQTPLTNPITHSVTTTSTGIAMTTKQKLKAAIQQNIQAGLLQRDRKSVV